MNIKYITLSILLAISTATISAQEMYSSSGRPVTAERPKHKTKGFDATHIIFGGGLGFGFGTVTNVSVSPIVGYRFNDNLSAGIGFGYQYVRVKDQYLVYDENNNQVYKPYSANMYSPSVWMNYIFYKNLFAHIEYEHNFLDQKVFYNDYSKSMGFLTEKAKIDVPCALVGIGFRQPISDRFSLTIMGLYDVIQDQYSPYKGTLAIRLGVAANF